MNKHNKIITTKTKKSIERNKSISNNLFKSCLFVLASSALFFATIIIIFVFIKGLFGVGEVWDDGNWLFGNKYDGVELFAAGFMVFNTIWTTFLATLIAVPISVLTALFITRIAPSSFKTFFFVSLSILASIPSVIYGAFGSRVIDWIIMGIFGTSSGALLTIVITLAFMIMPTITLITTASINAVDKKMETSSLALGATKNQTSFYITLRAAATGILVATILGVGRALGEATAVSMISVDPYTGPTLGLFNQIRLLTSTMFKGYNELEPDSIQEASMFAMALLLMITILFVFLTMRFVQKQQNPKHQSLKATKKIEEVQNLELIVEKSGLKNLSISKQKKYHKLQKKQKFNDEVHEYYSNKYNNEVLINKTTIKSTYEKEKARKSKLLGGLTWVVSSIGVLFLASIILFLVIAGYSGLSWEYISSTGDEGLQSAIFGTVLLIILSMALIIPLGIGTGIYFSVFAKDNKVNRILLTGIDILTGIPSLIFGIVGSVLFLSFANAIGFAPLAGAIILTLIVVPTVVQTTQEAIKSVPKESITGSLALGSTKTTSSLKIAIPQSIPQITSGIILAIGRIIGESAALVMIFGTVSRDSAADWMQLGGTTLATEMYSLTLLEEIPWHEIAAIGLVILSLILLLSLLSNYISKKDLIGSLGLLLSLLLILVGIFVAETIGFIIFILGILILIMTIFMSILNKRKR